MRSAPSAAVVSFAELPAFCPPSAHRDRHPRVYLPLSRRNPRARCPYCGASYVLEGAADDNGAGGGES